MGISLPKGELISLALTTLLYGTPIIISIKIVLLSLMANHDGLSTNRIIFNSVHHHGGDDILCASVYASTSHEDSPSVIPDACGGHDGMSTSYEAIPFDQVLNLLLFLAPFCPMGPSRAGVHRSEGR